MKKQREGNGDWQWGGCSDNIKFGEKEMRRFINKLEKGNDARTAFNLHNNEVGRKVIIFLLTYLLATLPLLPYLPYISKFQFDLERTVTFEASFWSSLVLRG